jgi:hypothetical protein
VLGTCLLPSALLPLLSWPCSSAGWPLLALLLQAYCLSAARLAVLLLLLGVLQRPGRLKVRPRRRDDWWLLTGQLLVLLFEGV